jgi:hypothetical protein
MRDYRMPQTGVTLSYADVRYTFETREDVLKGQLSCDCRTSRLIRDYCDSTLPPLECGHRILIVSLVDLDDLHAPARIPS